MTARRDAWILPEGTTPCSRSLTIRSKFSSDGQVSCVEKGVVHTLFRECRAWQAIVIIETLYCFDWKTLILGQPPWVFHSDIIGTRSYVSVGLLTAGWRAASL